jgi:hypothetical protein
LCINETFTDEWELNRTKYQVVFLNQVVKINTPARKIPAAAAPKTDIGANMQINYLIISLF